ncbi:hypothetical protein T4A_11403 [Trichinella pseudospiralis]|uniref:Uncharacterized protein n=1 Tax=Trichinella pseudospiralis TaxID=6337 RepID=A0A0V1ECD5_TRIPS|nr:hypothetical protein T4A_11403 [Trichinella pseudospiralis]
MPHPPPPQIQRDEQQRQPWSSSVYCKNCIVHVAVGYCSARNNSQLSKHTPTCADLNADIGHNVITGSSGSKQFGTIACNLKSVCGAISIFTLFPNIQPKPHRLNVCNCGGEQ